MQQRLGLSTKSEFWSNKTLLITLIILFGFILTNESINVVGIKEGSVGLASSGRLARIVTVIIGFCLASFTLFSRNGLLFIFRGNLAILFYYFFLAIISVTFSQFKALSLFKSFEILTIIFLAATIYTHAEPRKATFFYIKSIFWIYTITVISTLVQLSIFGFESQRQLAGATPFINFMLTSKHPGLVGNAVGFLAAITTLFGFYKYTSPIKKEKIIGFLIFSMSLLSVILSYTRSVLTFLIFTLLIYFIIERKFILFFISILLLCSVLAYPATRDKIVAHLKRGDTTQKMESLSGRTKFWEQIIERSSTQMILGEGIGTGTRLQSYEKTHKVFAATNAHNSIFEVIMSTGFIGAFTWILLMARIFFQLLSFKRYKLPDETRRFHNLIMMSFILSALRSTMNSTFVVVDYFFFLFIAFIIYGDSLKYYLQEMKQKNNA